MADELDLVKRLEHARATASNDDYSKPGTPERTRHVERLDAMNAASDEITRLRAQFFEHEQYIFELERDHAALNTLYKQDRTQLALKDKALEKIPSLIPTNWLDSLLTGPDAVRLSCPNGEVETLLLAVKARIEKHIAQALSPSMTDAK